MTNELAYKLNLYNLSLVPLYVIFILQQINIDQFYYFHHYTSYIDLLSDFTSNNTLTIFFIFLITLSLLSYAIFKNNNNYGDQREFSFEDITPAGLDHLSFLSTYIIPLIAFNINDPRSFLIVAVLLLIIGAIYIKSDLYYLNPILLLFGYKIYKAKTETRSVILIFSGTLPAMNDNLRYKDLGNNIYYVKKDD